MVDNRIETDFEKHLREGEASFDAHLREWYRKKNAAATGLAPPIAAIDPVVVGTRARSYIEAECANGREVSAAEAVQHIMAQNK